MPVIDVNGPTNPADVPSSPYADDASVRQLLGPIGNKLPTWVDVEQQLGIAHATAVEALGKAYAGRIPTFAGDALVVLRWAEAKLAAAQILDAIRVLFPDQSTAADDLRAAAYRDLDGGLIGYPVGTGADLEADDDSVRLAGAGPRVSSFTPLSVFDDPYGPARDSRIDWQ